MRRSWLLVLIAVTIVSALQVVGIALMLAMFVTPAATASLLTRRLPTMMAVSAAIWLSHVDGLVGNHSQWILITVLVVMQPESGGSLPHADEAEARCCVLLLGESTPVIFDG